MSDLYLPKHIADGSKLVASAMPQMVTPTIVERTNRGVMRYDVYSRLLRERIVFLGFGINDQVANAVIAQLLYLAYEDPEKDIYLYINSPGGEVDSGLAIYDTMQFVQPDVSTICMGLAASMATILLAAGTKGKRYALPNSTIHFHPAIGGMQGSAPDVEIQARHLLQTQRRGRQILADSTGQSYERISADFDRDRYMSAQEAKEYGFIDEIMDKSELGKTAAEV
jgi:ATP-dependent Clp protease protease subunit